MTPKSATQRRALLLAQEVQRHMEELRQIAQLPWREGLARLDAIKADILRNTTPEESPLPTVSQE